MSTDISTKNLLLSTTRDEFGSYSTELKRYNLLLDYALCYFFFIYWVYHTSTEQLDISLYF